MDKKTKISTLAQKAYKMLAANGATPSELQMVSLSLLVAASHNFETKEMRKRYLQETLMLLMGEIQRIDEAQN